MNISKYSGVNRIDIEIPILVLVHNGREDAMCVGAGADEEEDNQQQRLEVEEGRLPTR